MSAEKPRAYRGEEKIIFVSYTHKDSAEVLGAIRALNARGCRVWYDEGIEAGEDWANTLGKALEKASLVLYFASRQSVKSENVLRELTYAREHGIPILTAALGMIPLAAPRRPRGGHAGSHGGPLFSRGGILRRRSPGEPDAPGPEQPGPHGHRLPGGGGEPGGA